jgi:gliding motility-associated-like protein
MRFFYTLSSILAVVVLFQTETSFAQCSGASCTTPVPEPDAANACILPNPAALDCYYGTTFPSTPVSEPPTWCTSIENNHWFAFTADAASATFEISCFGCGTGNGIQAAVLSTPDCVNMNFNFVSACLGNIGSGTTQTLIASPLIPGENYYLCIDGNAGANCDYAINASVPDVSGPADGLCIPSSIAGTYTTTTNSNWTIQPPSAGNFIGSSMNTMSVNVQWQEPGPAQVCATSTRCPNAPEFCLDVIVGEDVLTQEDVDMCQGYTATCAGQTYSQPGSFMVSLPSFLNCDSVINCRIRLIPTVYTTEIVNICQGGTATCAGEEFFGPGIYPVKLTAYQGCDSVVNCNVKLVPTYISPFALVNICGPAEYQVCDNILTSSGLYSEICKGWLGCDSIVNVNLAILEPEAAIAPPDTLDCDDNVTVTLDGTGSNINMAVAGTTLYKWTGPGIVGVNNQSTVQVNQPGEYCLVLTHGRGGLFCSDTACVTVFAISAVPQLPVISGNPTPCGDSTYIYTATASGLPLPTSFEWTIPGNLSYTVLSLNSIQITWDTVVSGQLCVTAKNACGSSQPACLPLAVQPPIIQPVMSGPASVCAGGGNYMFTLNIQQIGTNYNWTVPPGAVLTGSGDTVNINFLNAISGQVCVTPQNTCGTGTPVCRNVQVNPIPTADLSADAQICAGESVNLNFALGGNGPFDVTWSVGNQNFVLNDILNGHVETVSPATTTIYKITSISDNSTPACAVNLADSVTVTVYQHAFATQIAQICEGQSLFVGGAAQTTSGVYTDSLNTIHGCDSVIVTTLTVFEIDTLILNTNTCDPAQVGTNTQTFQQTNGCDSVVINTVTLLPSNTTLLFDKSCDLNNVGVFTQNLLNIFGCDSTVITTVTFALSDTTLVSATTCDPGATGVFYNTLQTTDGCDSLIITTVTQLPIDTTLLSGTSCNTANVGVFTNVLSNQFGCDSTIITTITFTPLDTTFLTATSCDPAMTGVFSNTLTTASGCDSVIVTTVTLLPSSSTQLSGSSCNPAQVGVFTNVLSNQFGCDSTITTTITFFHLDTTYLTSASCDPAATGVFSNTLTTAGGCDSVIITTVNLLPSSTTALFDQSCNPASIGVFTTNLFNQFGCDSIVTLTVTFAPIDSVFLTGATCDPADAGVFSTTSVTPEGCDSVTISTITLLPSNQTAFQTFTCDPALAGVFVYPLINQFNCDSIVTETRTLLPSSTTNISLTTCDPTQVGTTTVVQTNYLGCDSTIITTTTLLPSDNCGVVGTLLGANIPCATTTGALTLTMTVGTPPFSYSVLQGGNTVSSGTVNQLNTPFPITGLSSGNYTVNISSPNGFSTSLQATLVQLVPPALSTSANSNFAGFDVSCSGAADGTALASVSGGLAPFSYTWSNGGSTAQISNLTSGTYTVTVVDANACTNVSTVALIEPTPLVVQFVVNDLDCFSQNDGAIQVQTSGGAPPYSFSLNNGPEQASNLFTDLTSGAYTLTASDANDCVQTEAIVVNAATLVNVDLGDDQKISLGDQTILQAIVNVPFDSILSVVWTPPFDSTECPPAGCLTQVVTPFITTVYSVEVLALNGCSDEDKITVIVDRRRQIYVPNVFSPNDDGANDLFTIYAKPGTVRQIRSLQIFDRWGDNLFNLEDFLPNSPTQGWDGRYKGTPMNPAVFVWVAEIEFIDGQIELYKGDVTIVR